MKCRKFLVVLLSLILTLTFSLKTVKASEWDDYNSSWDSDNNSYWNSDDDSSWNSDSSSSGNNTNSDEVNGYLDGDYIQTPSDEEDTMPSVDMTNVTLEKDFLTETLFGNNKSASFDIKVNSEVVLNEYDNAELDVKVSNEDMYFDVSLSENVLHIETSSEGKTTLTITINDKEFNIKVKIKKIEFKENYLIVAKGKKAKLKLKGINISKVKWKSSKPKIVSVDKSGGVKGIKEGNAVITAQIGDDKVSALVSSVPEIKKKAVRWAEKYIEKSQYSQPKRMQKGYYDCSSLVWKAYHTYGYNLLGLNYAPTAAGLCQMYEQRKQNISGGITYENMKKLKFVPGDLVFFQGEKNGRYKNIYHVELITGYNFLGIDEEGESDATINCVKYSPDFSGDPARL